MADTKISDLAAVTDVISTDEYVLARAGTTKKIDASNLAAGLGSSGNTDGWVAAAETWTYGSADDPTYTLTITGIDVTTQYSPGMRVRLEQSTGGTKYGIVTKVAFSTDTTVTVYMGTDYDLVNEAITLPYYSLAKAPFGFPLDPAKWTVEVTDTSRRSQSSPTSNTWYNPGSISATFPIGVWDVSFEGSAYSARGTASSLDVYVTLSTATNSESDPGFTHVDYGEQATATGISFSRSKTLSLTTKTTYYANIKSGTSSLSLIGFLNDWARLSIRAVCAYL